MASVVQVEGLRELLRVTDKLPAHVKREVRKELRAVAEPVRHDAQALFLARVDPHRAKTRYGVSVRKAGTISVEQRVKGKHREPQYRRPKFTDRVRDRSLLPALEQNEREVVEGFNRVLDSLERRWSA